MLFESVVDVENGLIELYQTEAEDAKIAFVSRVGEDIREREDFDVLAAKRFERLESLGAYRRVVWCSGDWTHHSQLR